jgi:hypothetical protein
MTLNNNLAVLDMTRGNHKAALTILRVAHGSEHVDVATMLDTMLERQLAIPMSLPWQSCWTVARRRSNRIETMFFFFFFFFFFFLQP